VAAEAQTSAEDESFRKIEAKRQLVAKLEAEISEESSALRARSSLSNSPSKAADKPAPAATKRASSKAEA
jgi:hypothetical protein